MSFRHDIEQAMKEALERHFRSADGPHNDVPDNLAESIRYSLFAPGKRIRPRLALECAEMIGLALEAAMPAALAIEMVHCFTLIHDDLPCMDNDDFRRGQPTNHKKFGEDIALLAGDGLMALALDSILDAAEHVKGPHFRRALARLSWAMGPRGVIGGQAEENLLGEGSGLAQLRQMHAKKTGALFSAALLIPKDLKGIADDSSEGLAIDVFAKELGLAFQVVDDLEDSATEATEPTSVLYFISKEEASRMTRQSLDAAMKSLDSTFGGKAQALNRIAAEVLQRLEAQA